MENNNRQDRPITCGAAALTEGDKIRLMHAIETTNDRTDEEARHFRRDLNRLLLMGVVDQVTVRLSDNMIAICGHIGQEVIYRTCHLE